MKIKPCSALLAIILIDVLTISVTLPAYASLESCAPDNGRNCIQWYFLDKNGAQIDRPSPVLIDTTHTHESTIKWYVIGETGSGKFQFKTLTHVSKGTPGMIKNCTPFSVEVYNGTTPITRQYECTINAVDNVGLGTMEIDLAVNSGQSLPFYDARNNFVGTSYQYATDVAVGPNAVPEFGQVSTLVLVISIVSIILISTRSKLSMIRG